MRPVSSMRAIPEEDVADRQSMLSGVTGPRQLGLHHFPDSLGNSFTQQQQLPDSLGKEREDATYCRVCIQSSCCNPCR